MPPLLKGKDINYYHRIRRGLGYVFDPLTSTSESNDSIFHDHSSSNSSWDLDNSIGEMFRRLSINMVSTSRPGEDDHSHSHPRDWRTSQIHSHHQKPVSNKERSLDLTNLYIYQRIWMDLWRYARIGPSGGNAPTEHRFDCETSQTTSTLILTRNYVVY